MHALMRYTIKPEALQTHLKLLRAVYQEMSEVRPQHLHWATYQLDDPHRFIEIVTGPDLPQPLPQLPSFQRYRSGLDDRCDGPVEFIEMHQVDTYPSPS